MLLCRSHRRGNRIKIADLYRVFQHLLVNSLNESDYYPEVGIVPVNRRRHLGADKRTHELREFTDRQSCQSDGASADDPTQNRPNVDRELGQHLHRNGSVVQRERG